MTVSRHSVDRERFAAAVSSAVRAARMAGGMTQRGLATATGLSHSMIVAIECGDSTCSLWAASQIAGALDITIDALASVLIDERDAAE